MSWCVFHHDPRSTLEGDSTNIPGKRDISFRVVHFLEWVLS